MKKFFDPQKYVESYNFIEISIDPFILNNFSNEDGMSAFLSSVSDTEEFKELKAQLLREIMEIVENNLTPKQKEILKLTYVEGKTQNEISKDLKMHQTDVHKTLKGNIDYKNNKKRYGGALKKIKKICAGNKKILAILKKMRESVNT